ncbi:GntR family transcriptional regulator [Nocardia mangyaensis]|uniref:GntR family transcriptional regulator n=1 Tax=Nocardia mangyaensis TaxID=2213200 RepID=A0A1J0VUU7_9NOCA|nr:GntR family transcriptional regulator [Nocardia mangyaensis]APE35820.1 GntR family transcriptional regulator [Nocardia mangyaensis]
MLEDGKPLFLQVAEMVENSIIDGSLPEEAQAPSSNELATFHRINPATAAKGLNQLAADGILHKKRGIGMFVTLGARTVLRQRRRERFAVQYIDPLIAEADKLGIDVDELKVMLDKREGAR